MSTQVCGHSSCTCQNMAVCDFALLWFCCLLKILFIFRQAFYNSSLRVQLYQLLSDRCCAAGETTEWKDLSQASLTIIASFLCFVFTLYASSLNKGLSIYTTCIVVLDVNYKSWNFLYLCALPSVSVFDLLCRWRRLLNVNYVIHAIWWRKHDLFSFCYSAFF